LGELLSSSWKIIGSSPFLILSSLISFTIFLNDDYEGGEFDLEIYGPAAEPRYVEIKKQPKTNCVIFHSDMWHRVRPVTKGVRKSLVGWVLGNQFK
jgi:PKHD-type hydroxylase